MKFVFFGKGQRSVGCLMTLLDAGYHPQRLVLQPGAGTNWFSTMENLASQAGIPVLAPVDPNTEELEQELRMLDPDLFVLAGYGKILRKNLLGIPKQMSINLHGGKLPEYRGSSPMNWALIHGAASHTLTIICVDTGVDTGDIIAERTFPIEINDTIRDLHETANREFPQMLLEVVRSIESGTHNRRSQNDGEASYYPLRFPEDGVVLWDMLTAREIHNRIRALTEPYPCACTWFDGREVKLLTSRLYDGKFYGEPGRIYRISQSRGLLVCAKDECLWIQDAVFTDNGQPLNLSIKRYDRLATVSQAAASWHGQRYGVNAA